MIRPLSDRRASRRSRLPFAAALASLLLAFAGSCKSDEPEGTWIKQDVEAENDRLLIDVTALSLQKSGFPVGAGIDPGKLTVVSGWHTSLAPFRGQGWREQCTIQYVKKAPRQYEMSIRVKKDKNDDLVHPTDISYAQWVAEPDDVDRARAVRQHILSLLGSSIEVQQKP
jgi:hypothetical protein